MVDNRFEKILIVMGTRTETIKMSNNLEKFE